MRSLLFLTILFFTNLSFASGYSIGVLGVDAENSDERTEDRELVRFHGGASLMVEREFNPFYNRLESIIFAELLVGNANVKYNHTSATHNSLKTQSQNILFGFGLRHKILPTYSYNIFVGGGGLGAIMSLVYDEAQFLRENRDGFNGFSEFETNPGYGYYLEGGMEFKRKEQGVRLLITSQNLKTTKFKTLGNSRVTIDYTKAGIFWFHGMN